ncbi:beta-lactamase-like protein [Cristinia sonorae]|uniref:Beta-lactamase-like protein n=1 Tax=Cristinia sonorae TaxID=1940300 RepID=A0A8K0UYM9_9AGAR|nr:beta-lactamase-like protein [Cristinia sonorae]
MATPTLPPPKPNQPYIHVSAVDSGSLELPTWEVIANTSRDDPSVLRIPSLAFFLRHSESQGKGIMFDLGIRRDCAEKDPGVTVRQNAGEALRKGGVDPGEVGTVILSHLHWDHVGLATEFPNATWVLGPGTQHLVEEDHPELWILPSSVPPDRVRILNSNGSPADFPVSIGPFPEAHDFFGDGSLYIINSPGHFQGHINVLARTSSDGSWIYLGGDTVHDRRLLTGEKEMAFMHDEKTGEVLCMHVNKEAAMEHVLGVRTLLTVPKVHVLLAHDWEWFEENKDGEAFLPGSIPPKLD